MKITPSSEPPTGKSIAFLTWKEVNGPVLGHYAFETSCSIATSLGYEMRHICAERYPSPQALARSLSDEGFAGIILTSFFDDKFMEEFDWSHFSSIAIHDDLPAVRLHQVTSNASRTIETIWHNVWFHGYRRPGFVFHREEFRPPDRAPQTWAILGCEREFGASPMPQRFVQFRSDEADSLRCWLSANTPDVVIGFSNAVYWWLNKIGVKAPADLGYASISLDATIPPGSVDISGPENITARIIEVAVRQLDSQIRNGERGVPDIRRQLLIEPLWREGVTLPNRSQAIK